jgi:hypothetical protein
MQVSNFSASKVATLQEYTNMNLQLYSNLFSPPAHNPSKQESGIAGGFRSQ